MSNVYEFIKETNYEGESKWYTTKNGRYVSDSLSFNKEEAYKLFEAVKKRGNLDPVKEIMETYEEQN